MDIESIGKELAKGVKTVSRQYSTSSIFFSFCDTIHKSSNKRRSRMDLSILKKKISSYRTPKGRITSVPDELLGEILHAWEQWTGPSSGFYNQLGVDYRKMGSMMGKAKKLKREGFFDDCEFAAVNIEDAPVEFSAITSNGGIEVVWENNRIIRFHQVTQLIEFLDKSSKSKTQLKAVA